jgi:hypothetical protein
MEIRASEPRGVDVDRSQIRERLRMSPAERFRLAVDAAAGVRTFREAFAP